MKNTNASSKWADGNCKTCGFEPASPWRALNADGSTRFGCVDGAHAQHADAWHRAQAPSGR